MGLWVCGIYMYSSHTFQTTKATFLIPIHSFYKRRWMHIMFSTCLGLWDVVWKIYFTKNFWSEFKVWYVYIFFLVTLQSKFSVGFHLELIKVCWTCFLYEFKSSNLLLFFFFLTSDMDIIFLNGLRFKKVLGQEKKLRSNFFLKETSLDMYQALQDHFKGIVMVSSTKIYIWVKAWRHVKVDKRDNLWNFSFKMI